jgi:WD repeat-containing protein 35
MSALLNKSYKECSKALSKLENMTNLSKEERERYNELAISIFTKYDPQNIKESNIQCPGKNCDSTITE